MVSLPGAWEAPGSVVCLIVGGKSSLLKIHGCINHTFTASIDCCNTRPNCQVVIAVFTRCVIDINYVQENNVSQIINTTDL